MAARSAPYILLAAVTITAFWPIFSLDFIRYDDTLYVTANPGVRQGLSPTGVRYALTAIVSGNYHPLTMLSHELDVSLFHLNPRGHHAVNLLFHVANVCALFRLLSVMTRARVRSFLVAGLFAVHPLRVESVAWVSERKDVLSTFLMLLTIGAYLVFVRRRGIAAWVTMLILYALSLMAKPMPVTLPFLLLLFDYWPLRRGGGTFGGTVRELPGLILEKLPLFALSAASCIITFLVQRQSGAVRGLETVPLSERLTNALVAYAGYLQKFFLPVDLAPHYPLVPHSAGRVALCGALLVAVSIAVLLIARRRPYLFVGWCWYVGMLVPVIGIIQVGSQALADRYTYTPTIGIAVAIVWLGADIAANRRTLQRSAVVACAVVIAVLGVATFHQTLYWKDSVTLFTRTLEVSPQSGVAHKILGLAYAKAGDAREALPHFERAMELNPLDRDNAFNLGTALLTLGRAGESLPLLAAAITSYDKPADAYANLGRALMDTNRLTEAQGALRKAIEIDPRQNEARLNLGIVEGMLNQTRQAVATLAGAVRRDPRNADARYNYGIALLNAGRATDAAKEFAEALRLRPNFREAADYLKKASTASK